MNMKSRNALSIAMAGLLTACASSGPTMGEKAGQAYIPYAGAPIDSFTAFDIEGWTEVSKTQVVIWARFNEAYLLTVWDTCFNLPYANVIGLSSTGSTVSKFDYLQVGKDRCQITEIRPVDIQQKKADERAAAETAPTP